LVTGIAAVIIADNPALTSAEVRIIIREGTDKIGPYAYPGDRNNYYGYGRVNLFNSLCPNNDGDAYTICANDCDDGNPDIHPDATEICDGLDNNCDTSIDEGFDIDSDNFTVCGGDCDDTDPDVNPDTYWYRDFDGDGYGDSSIFFQQCIQPGGPPDYVLDNTDYDDDNGNIYPGGPPVRVYSASPTYHQTIQQAYNAAGDGDPVQVQTGTYTENLAVDLPKSITVEGGYSVLFTPDSFTSIILGDVNVSDGIVTFESIVIDE
jgi:hypothetical protein